MTPDSTPPAAGSIPQPIGRRRFIQGAGALAGTGLTTSLLSESAAAAGNTSRYVPLATPERLLDSRPAERNKYRSTFTDRGKNSDRGSILQTHRYEVQIAGRTPGGQTIPANATAVVGSITIVGTTPAWAAANPGNVLDMHRGQSSSVNLGRPGAHGNMTTVQLSAGKIMVHVRFAADVIFDIVGYYEPAESSREGRFISITPGRAHDQRFTSPPTWIPPERTQTVDISRDFKTGRELVPKEASAVWINLTCSNAQRPGYFTVYPTAVKSPPRPSNMNANHPGDVRAVGAIVKVDSSRTVKVFSKSGGQILIDVLGYFTGPNDSDSSVGLFVPSAPQRLLDSRKRHEGQTAAMWRESKGRLWPRWAVEGPVPAPASTSAAAIVANLTMTETRGPGWLAMRRARLDGKHPSQMTQSTMNTTTANDTLANMTVSEITSWYGFEVISSHGAAVVVDYVGYFKGSPKPANTGHRFPMEPPPPSLPEWTLHVPRMVGRYSGAEHVSIVKDGDSVAVTDQGDTWHWRGSGLMGEAGRTAVFAHRTNSAQADSPFYNIHLLGPGDRWYVYTSDGRRYTYVYRARYLTDSNPTNIYNVIAGQPPQSFSLLACTYGYETKAPRRQWYEPTDLDYRIIVSGVLVEMEATQPNR